MNKCIKSNIQYFSSNVINGLFLVFYKQLNDGQIDLKFELYVGCALISAKINADTAAYLDVIINILYNKAILIEEDVDPLTKSFQKMLKKEFDKLNEFKTVFVESGFPYNDIHYILKLFTKKTRTFI